MVKCATCRLTFSVLFAGSTVSLCLYSFTWRSVRWHTQGLNHEVYIRCLRCAIRFWNFLRCLLFRSLELSKSMSAHCKVVQAYTLSIDTSMLLAICIGLLRRRLQHVAQLKNNATFHICINVLGNALRPNKERIIYLCRIDIARCRHGYKVNGPKMS